MGSSSSRGRASVVAVLLLVFGPASARPAPRPDRRTLPGGALKVTAATHWNALGGRIEVQPFARYRVTCRVKANVTKGTFYAPYCYEWDSYEWAFVNAAPITGVVAEWTRSETTFISPHPTMYVHPLAYMDAANSEATVEDVLVEKIGEPSAVMAEIEANTSRNDTETRLLARWLVARKRIPEAAKLRRGTAGLLHADLATVLSLASRSSGDRVLYTARAVQHGGPTYYEGVKRFHEMTAGMSDHERITIVSIALTGTDIAARGLGDDSGRATCARSATLVLESIARGAGGPDTLADRARRIRLSLDALRVAQKYTPAGSEASALLGASLERIRAMATTIEQERSQLGRCAVVIGGRTVTPTSHVIVLPQRASDIERYAARELQHHLELVTGQVVSIVREDKLGGRVGLFVGRCKAHADPTTKLAPEGLRVRTIGPALALTGNGRGVLYAVYAFLEDYLGCRWFTPDCRTWPRSGRIAIGKLDRVYAPPLEYRGGDYPIARPGEFAARVRLNGANHAIAPEQGGNVGVNSLAHTFAALCPPEKHFAEHPEYFSLVKGQRQSGYAQLCLTNPDVLKIAIEGVRKWIKDNPRTSVFSVSQNDTFNYCECSACSKVAEEEGSQAGPMIRFVNAVADAIGKDHPNVAIETLAYQYTRKPPKLTKPRPNVIVCLCSIECCFIHALATDPHNASFVEDIKGWSRICKRLWIWDYVINYAHSICPFPNLYVLKPNIRFFIENGVRGIYEESCYYTKGSELQELRNYIVAKTLWDPNYDTGKAIREFCAAFYGAAASHVLRYIELIHTATQRDPGRHVMIYTHPRDYVTPAMISQARTILDEGESAVKSDPTFLHRVQVARLPMLYAEIVLAQGGAWVEKDGKLVQDGATDVGALADRFERIARAEGVTMVREGGPDAGLDAWLAAIPRRPDTLEVVTIQGGGLRADILPGLGGRIWRLRRGETGHDLLVASGAPNTLRPDEGGYEEYSESGYRSPGWQDAYAVKERSERHVVLEADLRNGLRITRRIAVDAAASSVRVTTKLTNTSGAPRTACLRTHPAFAASFAPGSTVQMRRPDGSVRAVDIVDSSRPETDLWLRGDDVPAGEWTLADGSGLRLSCTFERGDVAQCLLNWSAPARRVNLELFSPERQLAPGESTTVRQTWGVGLSR
jgi:hypothetical protein